MTAKLTRAEQRELAHCLIQAAGDLVYQLNTGNNVEVPATAPEGMDPEAVARQLGIWLKSLPGAADSWDDALPPLEGL